MLRMSLIPDGFEGEGQENHRPHSRSVLESDVTGELAQRREEHSVPVAKILGDMLLVGDLEGTNCLET